MGSKKISNSPLPIGIIPASASVSTAIIRSGIQAGGICQFDILTSDRYGNTLSSIFYPLYGPRQYLVEIQYTGLVQLNASLGTVVDQKGFLFPL